MALGTLEEAVRAAYAELEGHFAFVAMSLDDPDVLVGAPQGVPARRRARRRRAVHRLRDPRVPGRDARRADHRERRDRRGPPRRRRVHDARGRRRSTARSPTSTGTRRPPRRRGYETFMLKEIHEQPDAVAETIADRTVREDGVDLARRHRRGDAARRPSASSIVACGTQLPRGPGRPLRDRGVGAPARRDGHRLRVPLPQPGRRPGRPRHRHHAVGRDRRHAGRDAPGRASAARRCSR